MHIMTSWGKCVKIAGDRRDDGGPARYFLQLRAKVQERRQLWLEVSTESGDKGTVAYTSMRSFLRVHLP